MSWQNVYKNNLQDSDQVSEAKRLSEDILRILLKYCAYSAEIMFLYLIVVYYIFVALLLHHYGSTDIDLTFQQGSLTPRQIPEMLQAERHAPPGPPPISWTAASARFGFRSISFTFDSSEVPGSLQPVIQVRLHAHNNSLSSLSSILDQKTETKP